MSQGPIKPEQWGRDHWSLLVYLETVAVDHRGVVGWNNGEGFIRLSCNPYTHPLLAGPRLSSGPGLPRTRLATSEVVEGYDDWDCFDDLVAAGFIENTGTGVNPVIKLTDSGWAKAHALRRARVGWSA